MEIEVVKEDLTKIDCDALVNAANNRLLMGGGVAGALRRAGGKGIEEEAVKKGPIPIGEAIVTGAGSLKSKYVIHAAVMGMDFLTDADKIRRSTRNSLLRAEELNIQCVAFPALGTGVGGFPLDECAHIMFEEVRRHKAASLKRVIFVLYDKRAYEIFKKERDSYDL